MRGKQLANVIPIFFYMCGFIELFLSIKGIYKLYLVSLSLPFLHVIGSIFVLLIQTPINHIES